MITPRLERGMVNSGLKYHCLEPRVISSEVVLYHTTIIGLAWLVDCISSSNPSIQRHNLGLLYSLKLYLGNKSINECFLKRLDCITM